MTHKHNKNMFIIFYNYYKMLKISRLKNQMVKLRFKYWLIIWQFVDKSNQGVDYVSPTKIQTKHVINILKYTKHSYMYQLLVSRN
jgi:hypothetical protein